MREPFVFVVGKGRSGTTLVRAMLTAHPDMAIPPETHFIVPLSMDKSVVPDQQQVDVDTLVDRLESHHGFPGMGLEATGLRRELDQRAPLNYSDAIRGLFESYALKQGKSRYGDKTPGHVLHIPVLAGLFEEARFVHVIRDGRNVMLSNFDTDFGPAGIAEGALVWRRLVTEGRRTGRALGPERYCEVRYEDLLEDPEAVIRRVSEFVSLDYHENMLRYFERGSTIVGSAEHHRNLDLPPTKGLRDWSSEMPAHQLAVFERLAGDQLEAFGYERSTARLGPRARAELSLSWMAFQARRVKSRLTRAQPLKKSVSAR
jgi:Sulfotransferase family